MSNVIREYRFEGSYYFHETPLPEMDYSINPYFGCEFACKYCYAMMYFKLRSVRHKWGRYIEAKLYLPKILSKNLHRFKKNAVIGIGTNSDPYTPWEARLKLTRKIIKILRRRGDLTISIQTKSPLVLRDLDIISGGKSDIGFSVASLDKHFINYFEPYAPRPVSRFKALEKIKRFNIETWIFIAPVMPFINDDFSMLDEILEYASKVGVDRVYSDVLRLRLGVRESVIRVLRDYNPSLIKYYQELNRPEIFKRYSTVVGYLRERSKEYGLEYVDAAEMMWDYIK